MMYDLQLSQSAPLGKVELVSSIMYDPNFGFLVSIVYTSMDRLHDNQGVLNKMTYGIHSIAQCKY